MKRSVLVSGIAGSGKSAVCAHLISLGYEAYSIEEDENGMFKMFRKDTGEHFVDFDNADPEKVKNADWICDVNVLKDLLSKQKADLAFYCGVASNMDDILPFFDTFILLKASPGVLHKRLSTREGVDDFGNTEEGRQAILGWKDWWEEEMTDRGALVVDADGSVAEVAQRVLETVGASK